jgi:hypothetical protein
MSYTGTTNISLAKAVVQNIIHEDINTLKSNEVRNMDLLDKVLTGEVVLATNATIVNTQGNRFVKLYMLTTSSIASITGLCTGAANYKLNANWNPQQVVNTQAAITLVWDGTNFVELGRTGG